MTYEEFERDLLALSPNSQCLKFLAYRIKQDNYRGVHISQHNRYDFDMACDMLYEFKKIAKNKKIKIRTKDISKHPEDMKGTEKYCQYCSVLHQKYGNFTQDTIRKNFFVDFARMGLINRYDKNENLIPITQKKHCQYVALTERAKILANKRESRKNKYIAFSKGLDMLSHNLALNLFNLSKNTEGKITRMEYTYFVSFLGLSIVRRQGQRTKNIVVSEQMIIDYINEYRNLKNIHSEIDRIVRNYCTPSNFTGNKKQKRDFGNWINETEQLFKLLSTTIYFEYLNKYHTLKLRVDGRMNIDNMQGLSRSSQEKENYFINHNIEKDDLRTLHHIVPLDLWEDLDDFKLLDDWRNMIFIKSNEHTSIHNKPSKYCKLSINNEILVLENNNTEKLIFTNGQEVKFSQSCKEIMLNYNSDLLRNRTL